MDVTRRQLVATPSGPARLHVDGEGTSRFVLAHGAGGGVDAPDLLAARDAGLALGLQVVRVEQPWRVRGARVAEAPVRLDAAWLAALATLLPAPTGPAPSRGPTGPAPSRRLTGPVPTVLGGRSSGARVACRTAPVVTADGLGDVRGVLCLAFPLRPPGRTADRSSELALPQVPRLVVQGERDAFGVPDASPGVRVERVAGADHGFGVRRRDGRSAEDVQAQVRDVVRGWLAELDLPGATR